MLTDPTEPNAPQPGFWTRLLGLIPTPRQASFDMFGGVVLPTPLIVLLISQSGNLRIFFTLCFGLGILTLAVWLLVGARLRTGHGFFIGVLWLGALLNALIALYLFFLPLFSPMKPLSALYLMLIMLPFVMIPLMLGLVYWRNGWHALQRMRALQPKPERSMVVGTIIIGLLVVLVLPLGLQWQASQFVSRNIQQIIEGDVEQGVRGLKHAFWCDRSCYQEIRQAYIKTRDLAHQERLKKAYFQLTGLNLSVESF